MGKRREGREVALQLLFHWDLNVQQPVAGTELEMFWEFRPKLSARSVGRERANGTNGGILGGPPTND